MHFYIDFLTISHFSIPISHYSSLSEDMVSICFFKAIFLPLVFSSQNDSAQSFYDVSQMLKNQDSADFSRILYSMQQPISILITFQDFC